MKRPCLFMIFLKDNEILFNIFSSFILPTVYRYIACFSSHPCLRLIFGRLSLHLFLGLPVPLRPAGNLNCRTFLVLQVVDLFLAWVVISESVLFWGSFVDLWAIISFPVDGLPIRSTNPPPFPGLWTGSMIVRLLSSPSDHTGGVQITNYIIYKLRSFIFDTFSSFWILNV